ncbi:MAG TPA: hypothetical protein PK054_11880 [Anaerohalosphaeraceae bacterium]|nr:hypothetical protein [Anaerohalosphaeraceae bacterium]HPP57263.1 hypothetical protein [Anaerohalosphaeraceae bacterium]
MKRLSRWMCIAAGLLSAVAAAAAEPSEQPARRVMAFYYPWYGTADGPGGAGRVVHWGRIEADKNEISDSTHYPLDGAYDSHCPQVIDRHCRQAQESGIDTLIVSWWGAGSYEDRAMPQILDACRRYGLTASIYYETVPPPQTAQSACSDILRNVLQNYASHPAWLRHSGKPVVFVYARAVEEIGLFGWHQVKQRLQTEFPGGAVLIGDGFSYGTAAVFDGLHTYNPAGQLADKTLRQVRSWCAQTYPQWIQTARQQGRIVALTVIPGYDDTKIRTPGLKVSRLNGDLYALQWAAAVKAAPDWILITSFNEWHEGSEIEPSVEYGDAYLKLTARFSREFRAIPPASKTVEPVLSASVQKRLQEAFTNRSVAVLPEPSSTAFWLLLKQQSDLKILSWQEVVGGDLTKEHYSMVLYAGGETYRTTVFQEGDVRRALEAYVQSGGTLAVLPAQPWPFYYNEQGHVVNDSARYGLTIKGGWEQPPADKELFFEPSAEKKVLSQPIPFPASGDRRWRPFVRSPHHVEYRPLLVLKDRQGNSYGDGLVLAKTADGGIIAYGWFGLLNTPQAEAVLTELFLQLTEQ